eukprot:4317601-Pyramimonas_sp.AAC.1
MDQSSTGAARPAPGSARGWSRRWSWRWAGGRWGQRALAAACHSTPPPPPRCAAARTARVIGAHR